MHSITLDTAAGILLLSSIISLVLQLKRTPRSRLALSTSVLSLSDLSSTILTASMVLLHHLYMNNVNYSNHETLLSRSANLTMNNVVEDCDSKNVLFQYTLFLVPFANAFMSLLSFSSTCYLDVTQIERRCCELTQSQHQQIKNEDIVEIAEEKELEVIEGKDPLGKTRPSRFSGKTYAGIAIISQWLVPVLFSGVFQLGYHQRLDTSNRSTDDLICTLAANFPFEDCLTDDLYLANETWQMDDTVVSSSVSQNYISSEDNLLWPNPNSTEVDDVLMRVRDIMQSLLSNHSVGKVKDNVNEYDMTQLIERNEKLSVEKLNFSRGKEIDLGYRLLGRVLRGDDDLSRLRFITEGKIDKFSKHDLSIDDRRVYLCAKSIDNRCVMPKRFLRIHLFIFLALVYLTPIFTSSLLLVASHYKCRQVAGKLKKSVSSTTSVLPSKGWVRDEEKDKDKDSKIEESVCELSCQAEKLSEFFRLFRMNALVAVSLWTPMFLQLLSRVFLCGSPPSWLMDVAFLATIGFAVFRNALNLNLVKIDADAEDLRKRNSVRPN